MSFTVELTDAEYNTLMLVLGCAMESRSYSESGLRLWAVMAANAVNRHNPEWRVLKEPWSIADPT